MAITLSELLLELDPIPPLEFMHYDDIQLSDLYINDSYATKHIRYFQDKIERFLPIEFIRERCRHGLIHGIKSIFFVLLGGLLINQMDLIGNTAFAIGSMWIFSYYLYLQK